MSALANHVARCHAHRAKTPSTGDARADAGLLAASVYGMADVMSRPVLINIAGLALAMDRLTVYRISTGAARLVHETDLHTLPVRGICRTNPHLRRLTKRMHACYDLDKNTEG